MTRNEKLELLYTLKISCEEGIDGRWDCSTAEGKEGFEAMIVLIDALIGDT